ncbi:Adenylate kinase 8 [Eumeta japonica]|uniref:Adenylate kinase 8 n=1 Tax=Eumeta variegata TaxID=151549 RepID=A0A4C1T1Z7_EUMVA|nr:Adenylate kinase 8 [Eumeta japonica]
MTETDATKRPLNIPENFVPYLEKHRIYKVFKDMTRDLVLNLPKDHLKHMKVYLNRYTHGGQNANGILLLVSPELKNIDHPCTIAEARGLQQIGVLPTVTLLLIPPPPMSPSAPVHLTSARNFFQQDFEALKFAYRSTIKEVQVLPDEKPEVISTRLFNAIRACLGGASGPNRGHLALGAPSVYRVLLLGPRGSGRLSFEELCKEAKQGKDEVGRKLRDYGQSLQLRAEIVARRIMQKDCIDHGWVMIEYPQSGDDFEKLDSMKTPPNRVIFLNADWTTCKSRLTSRGVNRCTGKQETIGSDPRVVRHPRDHDSSIKRDLEYYFSEALLELRAAAGITAVEIGAQEPEDKVQIKIQAAVMAAPAFDIEYCMQKRTSFMD